MKKTFLSGIVLLISASLLTGPGYAQQNAAKSPTANNPSFASNDSRVVIADESAKAGTDVKDIHFRALKHFSRDYKNVNDARWYADNKTIVASFEQNGVSNRVVYLKNGRWLHTLINYDESHLPENVRTIINDNFRNFKITWITEVHESDKVMYFVNIENAKRLLQVSVCNDEFGIYKDMRKAN